MKLGIIGVGAVGSATAMAAALRARVREIVLLDLDRARAKAVATDMHYGVALSPLVSICDGDYGDLADAGLAIITAGVNEKAGGATDRSDPAGRLRLLDANVKVFQDIVPKLVKAAPQAVILVATDPPEPLVDVARQLAGHDRVMGTSTYLDSLRFRLHVGERWAWALVSWRPMSWASTARRACSCGRRPGSAACRCATCWPSTRSSSAPFEKLSSRTALRQHHDHRRHRRQPVRHRHGLGPHRRSDPARRACGVPGRLLQSALGTTVSLPSIVGRQGVIEVLEPAMSDEEKQGLERSAARLEETVRKYLRAS